jgi:hypothetical protein
MIAVLIRRRRGRLLSVKSLTVLAGLGVVTAFALSSKFARPSAPGTAHLLFRNEPSLRMLSRRDPDAIAYRLVWLPTFDPPVRVRIDGKGEGATLRAEVLDGKGGYEPGQIAIDKTVLLGAEQVGELDGHLEETAFWAMPTQENLEGRGVDDGDLLIVEGVKSGAYHIVRRVMPDPAYKELCRYMLDLTGLETRKVWEDYHASDDQREM